MSDEPREEPDRPPSDMEPVGVYEQPARFLGLPARVWLILLLIVAALAVLGYLFWSWIL